MSTQPRSTFLVLPRLWATAADTSEGSRLAFTAGTIARRQPSETFAPGRRRGQHSLRLVQAQAAEAHVQPAPQPALKPQPAASPALRLVAAKALPNRLQPQLHIYRKYTEAMLRRYLTLSMEAGRVPSLLGRDLFRGNVSHCTVTGFDDVIIYVEDVNKCLAQLDPVQRFLVRKIAIEGYTQGETAAMRGLPLRSVIRRYTEAIDRLSRLFVDRKLMQPFTDPEVQ